MVRLNSLDKLLFIIVSAFLVNGFLLWILSNVIRLNDTFVWFLTSPISLYISYFTSNKLEFHSFDITRKHLKPYILFAILLLFSFIYLIQPVLSNPYATIGIPNKDLHDGISTYISVQGTAPKDREENSLFIPNSKNGLYLGYPNSLHSFSGYLLKLGVFNFHATWISVVIFLLITSISIFLLLKLASQNDYIAALSGGLFVLSSVRIVYAAVASIPMLYSYALVIPALLVCLVVAHSVKEKIAFLLPAIALSYLAASYSGIVFIFYGLLIIYGLVLVLKKDMESVKNLVQLIGFSLPFLAFTLFFQHKIYWENTFPSAIDYDPYELSQKFAPLDKPLYMIFYILSLVVSLYFIIKEKSPKTKPFYIY